ncbi:hypothetical protein BY996DRAFT_6414363 [Phakopsora pachyrhizi]|nr:hypothetical protein BY996DRAFT_6414363 [Phakopsora pachyrhizi]
MFNNNSSNEFLQNTKIPVFVGTILNYISFLLIDQSSFNSKLDVNVENVNNNHFVIINNVENKDLIIWPYAISPIFTGFLIWGVQVILTYRFQSLNEYYNFKFNSLNNNKNFLIDLLLFLIRKDSAYLSIDLCLGNIHLFCLLISLNLNQLLRKSEKSFQKSSSKDFKKSQKNKTGDIPMKDLTLEIPMNPLSARLSKSRISSDWTETFVDGIQSNLRNNNGSDLTIRGNSSSSASSFVGSSTTDLSSFKIRKN